MLSSPAQDSPFEVPPGGLQLLGRVVDHAWRQTRAEGVADGLRVLFSAGRLLGEREWLAQLFAVPAFAALLAERPQADSLFFIGHRHFLSQTLCSEDRVVCALDHFRFEQAHFMPALLTVLHGEGLCLWRHASGHEIRLRANADTRHEGPLSLVLEAGRRPLHEISFVWVEAERLDVGHGPVLFVTRNQSLPGGEPEMERFRAAFPQNAPSYFVLAALHGLAEQLGQTRIMGIRDICQIAFEPGYAAGFKRSYDDFWINFGGQPRGRHGYEMPVPARATPLEQVRSKHRARARQRREHWRQVAESARTVLSPCLRT